jgi:hypothetical protein
MCRVEGYCESRASIYVIFWGSNRVEGSNDDVIDGHAPTHVLCFGDLVVLCHLLSKI